MSWSEPGSPWWQILRQRIECKYFIGECDPVSRSMGQEEWSREGWKTNTKMSYEVGHSLWRMSAGFVWAAWGVVWKTSQDCPCGGRKESIYPLALELHWSKVWPQNILPYNSGLVNAQVPCGSEELQGKLWKLQQRCKARTWGKALWGCTYKKAPAQRQHQWLE